MYILGIMLWIDFYSLAAVTMETTTLDATFWIITIAFTFLMVFLVISGMYRY